MSSSMTVITIQNVQVSPMRRHVRIPSSDRTTQAWWERQGDPSASVRLLILEEARNHGLVDRVSRFGAQLGNMPPATPTGPTAVPNPPAQPSGPAAVPNAQATPSGPTSVPNWPLRQTGVAGVSPSVQSFLSASPFTAPGQPTGMTDAEIIEIDSLRAELDFLRSMVAAPPLFNVA